MTDHDTPPVEKRFETPQDMPAEAQLAATNAWLMRRVVDAALEESRELRESIDRPKDDIAE